MASNIVCVHILIGYDEHMGNLIAMNQLATIYKIFEYGDCDVKYSIIRNTLEISDALSYHNKENYEKIILIYLGHGIGVAARNYPNISPIPTESINLKDLMSLKNSKDVIIKMCFIYDCCNKYDKELRNNHNNIGEMNDLIQIKDRINMFLNLNIEYVCLRQGLYNYMLTKKTLWNEVLIEVILNYNYNKNPWDFLTILNCKTMETYKKSGKIGNKKN